MPSASIQFQIDLQAARADRFELLSSIVGRELTEGELQNYLDDHGKSPMWDIHTPEFGPVPMTMLHHAVWHRRYQTAMKILELVPVQFLHLDHVAKHPVAPSDHRPTTILETLGLSCFAEAEGSHEVRNEVVGALAELKVLERKEKKKQHAAKVAKNARLAEK